MKKKLTLQKIIFAFMIAAFMSLATIATFIYFASKKPTLGGDFLATSINGNWNYSDDAKDLNLLYIGYSKCPDVCPLALSFASQAFKQLSEKELNRSRFIFLSVDYDHDTAKAVADYASQFFPSFIGLIGTKTQVDSIVALFGASYMVETNAKSYLGYSIAHTDRIFFLNKKGQLIDSLPNPRSADSVTEKIKGLL
ncbi:MAG: SCO family protein [Pseudobdellovibrio sp.]